jgi:transcriptional regulator with XRE-family HTH domain
MPSPSLYDRLVALPRPQPGVPALPPLEIIAFNVSVTRKLRAWKQSTLADLAGVSLSTVGRIERGEKVQSEALEKIGAAFQFEPGYYTTPRPPLTDEEMRAPAQNPYPHIAPVRVSPLDSQAKLRALANCDLLVHAPLNGPSGMPDLEQGLFDLIATLGFRLAAPAFLSKSDLGGLRDLYRSTSAHLAEMHRAGLAVICAVDAEALRDNRRLGVIAIGKLADDPGVLARKVLMLDRRDFAEVSAPRGKAA